MSPFKNKKQKKPSKLGALFAVGSTVTLAPVLLRRAKDARRDGDKLALADAAVSGAALLVGVAQVLRARKGSPAGGKSARKGEA